MKKTKITIMLLLVLTMFCGCTKTIKTEEVKEMGSVSFTKMVKSGSTVNNINVDSITKIVISYTDSKSPTGGRTFAVNFETGDAYVDANIFKIDMATATKNLSDEEKEAVLSVYTSYIKNWKESYTTESEEMADGYSWVVIVSDNEGNVIRKGGSGSQRSKCTPEDFEEFVDAIEKMY